LQILGLSQVPVAGEEFEVVEFLEIARSRASDRAEIVRSSRLVAQAGEGKVTLHSFANAVAASAETGVERHQLNVVLKVDAQVCSGPLHVRWKHTLKYAARDPPGDHIYIVFLAVAHKN